mgnify:CR=1 FL=1
MKIVNKVLSVLAALLLGLSVISLGAGVIIRNTVLSRDYVVKKAGEADLYTSVKYEIKNSITSSGLAGSLSAQFLDAIITDDMIESEVNGIIESAYSGSEYQPDTASLTQQISDSFHTILAEYNVPTLNTIESLVEQGSEMVVSQYAESVSGLKAQIIGDRIKKIAAMGNRSLPITVLTALLSLALLVFINFKNKRSILDYAAFGHGLWIGGFTVMLSDTPRIASYLAAENAPFARGFLFHILHSIVKDFHEFFIVLLLFFLVCYLLYAPVSKICRKRLKNKSEMEL